MTCVKWEQTKKFEKLKWRNRKGREEMAITRYRKSMVALKKCGIECTCVYLLCYVQKKGLV